MKTKLILLLIALSPSLTFAQKKVKLNNQTDSVSYALAVSLATKIKSDGIKEFNTITFDFSCQTNC